MIWARCVSMVLTLTCKQVAVSLLVFPSASSCSTSPSRTSGDKNGGIAAMRMTDESFHDHLGGLAAEIDLTLPNRVNRLREALWRHCSSGGSPMRGLENFGDELLIRVHRQGDDANIGAESDDLAGRLDAV